MAGISNQVVFELGVMFKIELRGSHIVTTLTRIPATEHVEIQLLRERQKKGDKERQIRERMIVSMRDRERKTDTQRQRERNKKKRQTETERQR